MTPCASQYLSKYGESAALLKNPAWTKDKAKAEKGTTVEPVPCPVDCQRTCKPPVFARSVSLTLQPGICCAVAAAVLDWGLAEGATNFTHVFQPLGAVGVRHGLTGQVHNQLFTFGDDGKPEYKFKADELLRGETDGSSYPNGGLRSKCLACC